MNEPTAKMPWPYGMSDEFEQVAREALTDSEATYEAREGAAFILHLQAQYQEMYDQFGIDGCKALSKARLDHENEVIYGTITADRDIILIEEDE